MRILFVIALLYCSVFLGCSCNRSGTNSKPTTPIEQQQLRKSRPQINITSPKNNVKQTLGDDIILSVKLKDSADPLDSLRWFIDGKLLKKATVDEELTWNTSEQAVGSHRIEAVTYDSSGRRNIVSVSVTLLSDRTPKQYTYKVLQTYTHDMKAYTQGLLYEDGFLYESTGLKGESSLRKVNLTTGEPVQVMNIPADLFGEGLASTGDKLVQVTWQDQVAFIYRKDDFKLSARINYPMREGWGLTYDGSHLIMSDGSATLYFLDKEYLTEVRRQEVYDNKGRVQQLNELEYIDGEVWANIYQTDDIVRIDPATGIVLGRINMKDLLKPADRHPNVEVLNGIAYDKIAKKIYITGKNWPKLFEIQVVEK